MTPEATVRALTKRHAEIRTELDAYGARPLDALSSAIERHRHAIQLSALLLVAETRADPHVRERFRASTERVQRRMQTLRALGLRSGATRAQTRAIVEPWLDAIGELVDAAARTTTNAGRELLVRAYQSAAQLAGKRTVNSVPAELDST